jgi:hypothetical protein
VNASTARIAISRSSLLLAALVFASLAACATDGHAAGGPADTDLSVVDEGGSSVPGQYELWGHNKDNCTTGGSGSSVNLPEGDYTFTFTKERFGRLA